MERLTERGYNGFAIPRRGTDAVSMLQAIDRLASIEDILGDEYDLDRLRELVEMRHGKWVVYGNGVFCSNCGVVLKKGKIEPIGFHFCPHCGACMDKEAEHEVM